jgi:hypothetical protein
LSGLSARRVGSSDAHYQLCGFSHSAFSASLRQHATDLDEVAAVSMVGRYRQALKSV